MVIIINIVIFLNNILYLFLIKSGAKRSAEFPEKLRGRKGPFVRVPRACPCSAPESGPEAGQRGHQRWGTLTFYS